jgi:hypothetical protein
MIHAWMKATVQKAKKRQTIAMQGRVFAAGPSHLRKAPGQKRTDLRYQLRAVQLLLQLAPKEIKLFDPIALQVTPVKQTLYGQNATRENVIMRQVQ